MIDPGMYPSGAADAAVVYTYDALGRKKVVDYPNGAEALYGYEDTRGGWVQSIEHTDKNAAQLLKLTYGRDNAGLIQSIGEDRPDAAAVWDYVTWKAVIPPAPSSCGGAGILPYCSRRV